MQALVHMKCHSCQKIVWLQFLQNDTALRLSIAGIAAMSGIVGIIIVNTVFLLRGKKKKFNKLHNAIACPECNSATYIKDFELAKVEALATKVKEFETSKISESDLIFGSNLKERGEVS